MSINSFLEQVEAGIMAVPALNQAVEEDDAILDEMLLAAEAIYYREDTLRPEGVVHWLKLWYEAKYSLIRMMGGCRIDATVDELGVDDSESDADQDGAEEAQTKERMRRELLDFMCESLCTKDPVPYCIPMWWGSDTLADRMFNNVRKTLHESLGSNYYVSTGSTYDGSVGYLERMWRQGRNYLKMDKIRELYKYPPEPRFIVNTQGEPLNPVSELVESDPEYVRGLLYHRDKVTMVDVGDLLRVIFAHTPLEKLLDNKVSTGMRLSRFLASILPEDKLLVTTKEGKPILDAINIAWSRVIQEYKAKDTTRITISAAPIDYVMISVAEHWTSCHSYTRGCYGLGGVAYGLDDMTLVGYTASESMNALNVDFDNKTWRQNIHVDLEHGAAAFAKQYPNTNSVLAKSLRTLLNRRMAEYLQVESKWTKANGRGNIKGRANICYLDECQVHTKLKAFGVEPEGVRGVYGIPCIACGGNHIVEGKYWQCRSCYGQNVKDLPNYFNTDDEVGIKQWTEAEIRYNSAGYPEADPDLEYGCSNCGFEYYGDSMEWDPVEEDWLCINCFSIIRGVCADCEHVDRRDNMYWIADAEDYVCDDCYSCNGYFCCEDCGEYFSDDVAYSIGDGGYVVCERCFNDNYYTCEICGYSMHSQNTWTTPTDGACCEYCFDENYRMCDVCNEVVDRDETRVVNYSTYCADCYDENFVTCISCGDDESPKNESHYGDSEYGKGWLCESCYKEEQTREHKEEAV